MVSHAIADLEWVDSIPLDFMNNNNDKGTTHSIQVSGGQLPTETLTVTCISSTNPAVLPCGQVTIGTVAGTGMVDIYSTSGTTAGIATVTLRLSSSLNSGFLTPLDHTFTVRVYRTYWLVGLSPPVLSCQLRDMTHSQGATQPLMGCHGVFHLRYQHADM